MENGNVVSFGNSTWGYSSGSNNLFAANDLVAVEPFPKSEAPTQVTKSGFTRDIRRGSLVKLLVIHGTTDYPTGTYVYVKSDNTVQPWAKEVFELDGKAFMMMPTTAILLRSYNPSYFSYTAPPITATGVYPSVTSEQWEIGSDGVWRRKG